MGLVETVFNNTEGRLFLSFLTQTSIWSFSCFFFFVFFCFFFASFETLQFSVNSCAPSSTV